MNRYVIAGNWKMNLDIAEVGSYFTKICNIKDYKKVTMILCPAYPLLIYAQEMSKDTCVHIGAQNVSEYEKGAYTGEVSASILKSIYINYCIIGHSERRQFFGETDDTIRQKWLRLRERKISPIVCIGETLQERESGETFAVIDRQLKGIFRDMQLDSGEDLNIAYEPVWAIGTGKTATPQMAQEVHKYIRDSLTQLYGDIANHIPILYGGSVKPTNIKELLTMPDINGALIGGASLLPDDYAEMVKIAGELH
jgi:triosephosphate isomerase